VASEEKTVTLYEEIVDALNAINGVHDGCRAVHAKGTVCEGTFTATPEAKGLSRAAHLRGEPVRATVRLSNASGNPHTSDAHPIAGRGMAVKFHLPEGEATDIVSVPLEVFMVRTAEDFLTFTRARVPDPETGQPDQEKVGAFLADHPETGRALQLSLPKLAPTTSFATSGYNALHAFGLVNAEGETTWGRYRWVPAEGVHYLSEEQMGDADRDFLQDEIRERLGSGTATFALDFVKAGDGDSLEDPTEPWEGDRETVTLGELELTGIVEDPETPDQPLVFDPLRLTDGIEPSADQILAARPKAYDVSIRRRCA
jgi:catalase